MSGPRKAVPARRKKNDTLTPLVRVGRAHCLSHAEAGNANDDGPVWCVFRAGDGGGRRQDGDLLVQQALRQHDKAGDFQRRAGREVFGQQRHLAAGASDEIGQDQWRQVIVQSAGEM